MSDNKVDKAAELIESLSPEEQKQLTAKLKAKRAQQRRQENYQKLLELRSQIFEQQEGTSVKPGVDELIYQMREERLNTLFK